MLGYTLSTTAYPRLCETPASSQGTPGDQSRSAGRSPEEEEEDCVVAAALPLSDCEGPVSWTEGLEPRLRAHSSGLISQDLCGAVGQPGSLVVRKDCQQPLNSPGSSKFQKGT